MVRIKSVKNTTQPHITIASQRTVYFHVFFKFIIVNEANILLNNQDKYAIIIFDMKVTEPGVLSWQEMLQVGRNQDEQQFQHNLRC